jgi:hypothetical protein
MLEETSPRGAADRRLNTRDVTCGSDDLSPLQATGSCLLASWHFFFKVDAERAILGSSNSF